MTITRGSREERQRKRGADLRIRPADHSDVASIIAIVNAAYAIYIPRLGRPPGKMLDDYAALVLAGSVWVADVDDGLAGLLVLLPQPGHLLLDNVAVDPKRQGQGIGGALLQFADDEARRLGFSEMRLYTSETMTENIALYPRLGWTETGRGVQSGYNRVFFSKTV
jgi:GNAT superfamily N-acetyltransferase